MSDFLAKKKYFKERQLLYEQMKSLKECGDVVEIDGKKYKKVQPEDADHVFIWFDRKPMILHYNAEHKGYIIGNFQYHVSNPSKKTNRVIEFVRRLSPPRRSADTKEGVLWQTRVRGVFSGDKLSPQ